MKSLRILTKAIWPFCPGIKAKINITKLSGGIKCSNIHVPDIFTSCNRRMEHEKFAKISPKEQIINGNKKIVKTWDLVSINPLSLTNPTNKKNTGNKIQVNKTFNQNSSRRALPLNLYHFRIDSNK